VGKTSIEWTDQTWNPVTGCDKVSPGCDHCYAEGIAHRFAGTPQFPNGFGVTLRPERLDEPLHWRKPRRVFVNSMSDLFHADIPDEFIARVFATMARAPQHTFQILTKRPGRMRSLLADDPQKLLEATADEATADAIYGAHWPLPNVWLGVSAEDQKWANVRIPVLLDTPAAVRFVSAEPLLGPIDMRMWLEDDPTRFVVPPLDWVIVGGESGPGARPVHPDWVFSLRDQCVDADVPFLFKQWGAWMPNGAWRKDTGRPATSPREHVFEDGGHDGFLPVMARVGKTNAGRLLDGRTWDEYPKEMRRA
jgi:protein gp37